MSKRAAMARAERAFSSRATMRLMRARAVLAAALLAFSAFAPADAHPTLVEADKCDDEAHPSTRRLAHAAPVADPSISFRMAWSAPDGGVDPQPDEDDSARVIPEARHITTAEYKPGARHTLTVYTPVEGEFILTASAGAFEDFGQRLDGHLGYGLGLGCPDCCGGRRYNVKIHLTENHIIWNAPSNATSTADVTFKVTAAAGGRDGFRVNSVVFHANPSLPAPGDASSAPPAPSHLLFPPPYAAPPYIVNAINPKFVLHGWIMTIAWGALVPFGVWAARFARAPPDAPPARSATLESIRSGWFRLHWILNTAGLAFAAVGWLLAHTATDEDMGEDAHFSSDHAWFGAATLALGAYQPLNAYLRPPNPTPQELAGGKSAPRRRWEWVHRLSGVAALIASVVAVTTGCDRAVVWGATRGGKAGKAAYVVWLGAVIWITIFLEFARRRERKATGADRAMRAQTFVELSEDVCLGDGEGHRESPEEAA